MRRSVGTVLVTALVLGGGLSWNSLGAHADSSTTSSSTALTTTPRLVTTTTRHTTTTLFVPKPVCVRTVGSVNSPTATFTCHPWRHLDTWYHAASILTTSFAPNAAVPSVIATATWIRSSTTDLSLYLGYKGPDPSYVNRGPEMVPPSVRGRLLATFNSGFYEADGAAGFYVNHTLYHAMINGLATVERFSNGRVDVVRWTGPARPGANIQMARQNLPLMVNAGRPTPLSANNANWGSTLGGVAAVWRSALGIDPKGNLVYVAAPEQTSSSLAAILVELHIVRGMQLDINPEWPIFVSYAGPGARGPALIVPNPNQTPGRFLYPSIKDFFSVYTTHRLGEAQPW